MKRGCLIWLLLILPASMAAANCDITKFRWGCDVPLHVRLAHHVSSLVYCGHAYGYVTKADYQRMVEYQRADINMVLTINGEYVDSPCLPDRR